ncbi:sugar ABC transporter substrate-binding protein [Acuticoccus sp.]|uniref:sugar ABC transporter substrate-binding protein n=1 Tax=Acuticoccus sp. TaxID=1904378 RepID=UPI003B52B096
MADAIPIAVVTKNRTNPAYVGARQGVDRLLAGLGAVARHYVPEVPDDVDQQVALIHQALAEEPAAILLAPCHRTRLHEAVAAIADRGVPLFEIVSEVEASPALMFVGSDNAALGAAMAHRMAEHLGGRGRVGIVDGHPDAETAGPRARGFRDALAAHPHIDVAFAVAGNYQRDDAEAAVREALGRGARPDGVIVANDYMALGVIDALDEARLKGVPVIGANVTPAGVALIRSGRMLASAAFDALSMGAVAAEGAVRHLRGEPVPRRVTLPAELVDPSNLDRWDRDYADRTTIGWDEAVGE